MLHCLACYCLSQLSHLSVLFVALQHTATRTVYFKWKEFPNCINLKWHWFSHCKSGCTIFHLIQCLVPFCSLSPCLSVSVSYFAIALFVQPIVSSRTRICKIVVLQQYHIARMLYGSLCHHSLNLRTFCSSEPFSWLLSIDRHRYSFKYACVSLFRFAWFHKHNIFSDCFPFGSTFLSLTHSHSLIRFCCQ